MQFLQQQPLLLLHFDHPHQDIEAHAARPFARGVCRRCRKVVQFALLLVPFRRLGFSFVGYRFCLRQRIDAHGNLTVLSFQTDDRNPIGLIRRKLRLLHPGRKRIGPVVSRKFEF